MDQMKKKIECIDRIEALFKKHDIGAIDRYTLLTKPLEYIEWVEKLLLKKYR